MWIILFIFNYIFFPFLISLTICLILVYQGLCRLCCNPLNSYYHKWIIAAGIVLFLLVEKLVRYVDENSGEADSWGHGHHHHHHNNKKLKNDDDINGKKQSQPCCGIEEKGSNQMSEDSLNRDSVIQQESLRRVSWGITILWLVAANLGSLRSDLIWWSMCLVWFWRWLKELSHSEKLFFNFILVWMHFKCVFSFIYFLFTRKMHFL